MSTNPTIAHQDGEGPPQQDDRAIDEQLPPLVACPPPLLRTTTTPPPPLLSRDRFWPSLPVANLPSPASSHSIYSPPVRTHQTTLDTTLSPTPRGGTTSPSSSSLHLSEPAAAPKVIIFDNTKAGLETVDKEKTETIIKEFSKDSSYYTNEERKAQNRQRHIESLLAKTRVYQASVRGRPEVWRQLQREVKELEASMEARRVFSHIYVHMDMDMFYAAVEMKKHPHYRDVPLGIGTIGMLSTTNYVARQYGVRSGMAGFIGKRLCPDLVIVPTDFPACRAESAKFKAVVREYDPSAHGFGLDELMMCLNDHLAQQFPEAVTLEQRFDVAESIVAECRARVHEATELTASAGIAPTPTLAKMASNFKKPNGQSAVRLFTREAVMNFLATTPVRQVPGIGRSTEAVLAGLGIHTLGELYEQRHRLYFILTRKTYLFLLCSALGVGGMYDDGGAADAAAGDAIRAERAADDAQVDREDYDEGDGGIRKSVGQERTFRQLISKSDLLHIAYRNLRSAHSVLIAEHLLSSQVVLKLKFRSFQVKQFTKSMLVYTNDVEVLERALDEVLLPVADAFPDYRLLGVRLERLKLRSLEGVSDGPLTIPRGLAAEEEAGQRTLNDFFPARARPSSEKERDTTATNQRKRSRTVAAQELDAQSEEVLLVSSGSQLAGEEDDSNRDRIAMREEAHVEDVVSPVMLSAPSCTPPPSAAVVPREVVDVSDSESNEREKEADDVIVVDDD